MKLMIGSDRNTFYIMNIEGFTVPYPCAKILKSGQVKFTKTGFTRFKTEDEAQQFMNTLNNHKL